jgi:hypothetical protein
MRRNHQHFSSLHTVLRPSLIALVLMCIIGCEAAPQGASDPRATAATTAFNQLDPVERSRRLLLGSEVGLEVREWIIEADSATIARAMAGYRADAGEDESATIINEELAERLRLNGLRAVPVRLEDLPALESALGYATLNRRGWYGQLAEWMPLHGQRAGGPQQALFINGRPQRFDRGEYRLMSRAWVLPMEDGPRLNLQLVPEYHPPQRESLRHLLAQPTHDGTRRGQPITSITLDLLIKPGYALILTGEEPSVQWKADAAAASCPGFGRENPSARSSRDDDDSPGDSSNQYQTHLGPYVELPPTLGEMLFKLGGVRGGRGVLIFVPRVPDELQVRLANEKHEQR